MNRTVFNDKDLQRSKEAFTEWQNRHEGLTDESDWKGNRHAASSNKVVCSCQLSLHDYMHE